jgi:hypothetical protein
MEDTKAVFIGGTGRSGTSLLGWVFNLHPDVFYFNESRLTSWLDAGVCGYVRGQIDFTTLRWHVKNVVLEQIHRKMGARVPELDNWYTPAALDAVLDYAEKLRGKVAIGAAVIDGLFSVATKRAKKRVWVEKTPHHVLNAHTLYEMFPNMRLIHIIREPKDVYCSFLTERWIGNIHEFVQQYTNLMIDALNIRRRLPDNVYTVTSLERLVSSTRREVERLFAFADIVVTDEILDTCCKRVVTKHPNPIGRWRRELSDEQMRYIDKYCYPIYLEWKEWINQF